MATMKTGFRLDAIFGATPVRAEEKIKEIDDIGKVKSGIIFVFSSKKGQANDINTIIGKLKKIAEITTNLPIYILDYDKVDKDVQDKLLDEPYNFATQYPLFIIRKEDEKNKEIREKNVDKINEDFWNAANEILGFKQFMQGRKNENAANETPGFELKVDENLVEKSDKEGIVNLQKIKDIIKKLSEELSIPKSLIIKALAFEIAKEMKEKKLAYGELFFRQIGNLSENEPIVAMWLLGSAIQNGADIQKFPKKDSKKNAEDYFLDFVTKHIDAEKTEEDSLTLSLAAVYALWYAIPQLNKNIIKEKDLVKKIEECILSGEKNLMLVSISTLGASIEKIEKFGVDKGDNTKITDDVEIIEKIKEIATTKISEKDEDINLRKAAIATIAAIGKYVDATEFSDVFIACLNDEDDKIKIATMEAMGKMIIYTKNENTPNLLKSEEIINILNELAKAEKEEVRNMAGNLLQLKEEIEKEKKLGKLKK